MAPKIITYGASLDKARKQIILVAVSLEKQILMLDRKNPMKAYVHFKKDRPNCMYLLSPIDHNGKRKYTYIGVNRDKQKAAKEQIAHWFDRERLKKTLSNLMIRYQTLDDKLQQLVIDYDHLLVDAKNIDS